MGKLEYETLKRQSIDEDKMARKFLKGLVRQARHYEADGMKFWSTIGWKLQRQKVTHLFKKEVEAAAIGHAFQFRRKLKIKSLKTGIRETVTEFFFATQAEITRTCDGSST